MIDLTILLPRCFFRPKEGQSIGKKAIRSVYKYLNFSLGVMAVVALISPTAAHQKFTAVLSFVAIRIIMGACLDLSLFRLGIDAAVENEVHKARKREQDYHELIMRMREKSAPPPIPEVANTTPKDGYDDHWTCSNPTCGL